MTLGGLSVGVKGALTSTHLVSVKELSARAIGWGLSAATTLLLNGHAAV
jgi:hypothetical protein